MAANPLDDAAPNAEISVEHYKAQQQPRFGAHNPEQDVADEPDLPYPGYGPPVRRFKRFDFRMI